jgi:FkbM family methyltransferase
MSVLTERLAGQWGATWSLVQFLRAFRNWNEVWAAYRAGLRVPTLKFRNGLELHHGEGDDPIFLFREIFLGQFYTSRGFYVPKAGDVVLDLGANIGAFALFLESRARGIRVHCFEPAGRTRATLQRNVEANGLGELVKVYAYAVSDHHGVAALQQTGASITRSFFREEFAGAETEPVECVGLAEAIELCGAARVDLLKVDVEGAEIEVVEGMEPSGWGRIDRVVVEYHRCRPGSRDRVTRALRDRGYGRIETIVAPGDDWEAGPGIIHASRG